MSTNENVKSDFRVHVSRQMVTSALLSLVQRAHLAMMDALMTLAAKDTVSRVKMAVEVEQMGVGAPWENALLFWVNRVRRAENLEEHQLMAHSRSQFVLTAVL